jgi:hypothetical protein
MFFMRKPEIKRRNGRISESHATNDIGKVW